MDSRVMRITGAVVAVIVVLGVLAQVLLPGVAANRVRDKVEQYGTVKSVEVKAWPAVRLLFKHADEVKVRAGDLKMSLEQAVKLLEEAKGAGTMVLSAESLEVSPLSLADAKLEKHGDAMHAEGVVSLEGVEKVLPSGFDVQLVKSEAGKITVRASGGPFGANANVEAVAEAEAGKLVVHPTGFLIDGLKLTLFENPSVYIEGVEAHALGASRYRVSMQARLR
jgi:hypothetical protein